MSSTIPNTADTGVAQRFLTAYGAHDWDALRALLWEDATWTLPGDAVISGTAAGPEAIVARVRHIVAGGVTTELLHVVTGQDGVALLLRNTAEAADGRRLDEHLATLLRVRDGRIAGIETYLSDVPGMVAFFGRAGR